MDMHKVKMTSNEILNRTPRTTYNTSAHNSHSNVRKQCGPALKSVIKYTLSLCGSYDWCMHHRRGIPIIPHTFFVDLVTVTRRNTTIKHWQCYPYVNKLDDSFGSKWWKRLNCTSLLHNTDCKYNINICKIHQLNLTFIFDFVLTHLNGCLFCYYHNFSFDSPLLTI